MSPRVAKATTIAWVTNPRELGAVCDPENTDDRLINSLVFSDCDSMDKGSNPWFRVGTAEITVTLVDKQQVSLNAVDALRSEQKSVRAEAERRSTEIERQIQSLLAISYDGSAQ